MKCKRTGKMRYRDELAAKIALAKMSWRGRDEKRAYRCQFCHGWHTTSQERRTA